jgi:TPP-dependent indolepyruvate ferredoxin oxidoreductase alpha subunit
VHALCAQSQNAEETRPFEVSDRCKNHRDCINELGCPAFYLENQRVRIDPMPASAVLYALRSALKTPS